MRRFIDIVQEAHSISERLDPFSGMSREDFLGSPRITSNGNAGRLTPKVLTSHEGLAREPFLGKYEAIYNEDGAVVFDGDTPIASYNFGDTLVVDRRYRRQGIGAELVYQWRIRNPQAKPATHRTKAAQAIQNKVWDRIQSELKQR